VTVSMVGSSKLLNRVINLLDAMIGNISYTIYML